MKSYEFEIARMLEEGKSIDEIMDKLNEDALNIYSVFQKKKQQEEEERLAREAKKQRMIEAREGLAARIMDWTVAIGCIEEWDEEGIVSLDKNLRLLEKELEKGNHIKLTILEDSWK